MIQEIHDYGSFNYLVLETSIPLSCGKKKTEEYKKICTLEGKPSFIVYIVHATYWHGSRKTQHIEFHLPAALFMP